MRHRATDTWMFSPPWSGALEHVNLKELVARPERFEHHLVVCAKLGVAQLEIVTASEPLYFSHVNISDEYAVALPTGDPMVDGFPLRTFVTDPATQTDVARYNHRAGDLVLHPVGFLHWPGKLRPPYEGMAIPPGMRRCGLSLVYCASQPTPSNAKPIAGGDIKAYVTPAPPLSIAPLSGPPGVIATIGSTSLELVERPSTIAPPHGGWVVVLDTLDLIRVPAGGSLAGDGITRALVLSGTTPPDPPPAAWARVPPPPIAPFEDGPRGTLPFEHGVLRVEAVSSKLARVTVGDASADVPRYWLARMLFRVALHDMRLNYVETYEGFVVADSDREVSIGLRGHTIVIPRDRALAVIEALYRAVAPDGYYERIM